MRIVTENISRTFFRNGRDTNFFYAVKKTDFILEAKKVTEIIGRSGSGKTTFSNMLCGLLEPTEGKVLIDGVDFYSLSDDERSLFRNQNMGIIPQGQTGLQSLTVLENILLPSMMYPGKADRKEEAAKMMKMLQIDYLAEVYSNELSGGELRRMSILRALINDPKVIIADEPTGDLDDETTEKVLCLLKEKAEQGAAVLLVTHDREALKYADEIYRMEQGVLTKERREQYE